MNPIRAAAAVAIVSAFSMPAADFFPLQTGNTWKYRHTPTGQQLTIEVGAPVAANGHVYYSLTGYADRALLVRTDANQLLYFDEEGGREGILTSFVPFEAGWWEAPFRICDTVGQAQERRTVHDGPAGPLENVLNIRYLSFGCADVGTQAEQYAENIGLVRRIVTTFIGPRQYDFVYARIGKTTLDTAASSGRFSVGVIPIPQTGNLAVTLRLELNPQQSLKLTFPSGQEFDVALTNEAGQVLVSWSADKLFPQAVHEVTVASIYEKTVEIPLPPTPAIPGQAFRYVVRGWLTTDPAGPQFAAAAPLTIGGSAN